MKPQRLFLALWPGHKAAAATSAAARRWLQDCPCRLVPAQRLHLTLVFLGNVTAEALPGVKAAARSVSAPGFELALDTAGFWRRAGVAWLAPSAPPPALKDLAAQLRKALQGAGFELETRSFRPHVTIARKLNKRPVLAPGAPVNWRCGGFCLVHSVTHASGPQYRQIAQFPLGRGVE